MTRMVTVLSAKGGVGKTVTAVHLAAYFQQYGATLLVDGDATRSATLWAQPGRLPFKVVPERSVSRELTQTHYDFIIVDTEANPTESDFRELAESSHFVVIPSIPDALGIQGTLQTVEKLKKAGNVTPFKILLTIIPPKPNRDGEDACAYFDEHGLPRFRTGIRRTIAFSRAIIDGVTVDEVDRTNLGWYDYEQVGDEIRASLGL
jgi:chromosome partitioning protein